MKTLVTRSMEGADHCLGVAPALAQRGAEPEVWLLEYLPQRAFCDVAAVVLPDCCGPWAIQAIRRSRQAGARTVLVQDGVCEWRNMYRNSRRPAGLLCPAPVDGICCAGEQDRLVLEQLGNRAIATGLPRLDGLECLPMPEQPTVMVATAKHAWFTRQERELVLEMLAQVRETLARRGIDVLWRVGREVAAALGVEQARDGLREILSRASVVMTMPSTVLVESMLAGRPAALLHPFESPCWLPSVWSVRAQPGRSSGIDALDALHKGALRGAGVRGDDSMLDVVIDDLLQPGDSEMEAQQRLLGILHCEGNAADAVAKAVLTVAGREPGAGVQASLPTFGRLPSAPSARQQKSRCLTVVTQPECANGVLGEYVGKPTCIVDPCWDCERAREFVASAIVRSRAECVVRHEDFLVGESLDRAWQIKEKSAQAIAEEMIPLPGTGAVDAFRKAMDKLRTQGCCRVVVYGIGLHTHCTIRAMRDDDPIVGFLDDSAFDGQRMLGLPVVRMPEVIETLQPDAILISSDVWESQMRQRCAGLESSGVRIMGLYGDGDTLRKESIAAHHEAE